MEKNSIQSIIYHANILNYDKAFFQELILKGLKFDFDRIGDEMRCKDEVTSALQFLNKPPKEQINLINATFQDEDENILLGDGNKEVIEKQVKNSTKAVLELIFKLLIFSKKILSESRGSQQSTKSPEKDNITYGLLYLDGLIMINIDLFKHFQVLEKKLTENFDQILLSIIEEPLIDKNSQEIASHLLSVYLMYSTKKDIRPCFIKLMEWTLSYCLETNRGNCLTANFSLLLTNDDCVKYFFKTLEPENQCIRKLFEYMVTETNINLIYESLFCLWNISNCKDYVDLFENRQEKYLEKIVQVIRTNKIDKVARIGLMIIHNIKESETCMEILFNIKFMRTIDILLTNKWNDQSIKEMLHLIYDYLDKNYKSMISFEKYIKELNAGDLKAGSLHTPTFWEDNYREFEYNHFEYIRRLVMIIKSEDAEENIEQKSIACFDIGEFARLYPGGANLLEEYKTKDSLLLLIQHKNIDLKNRALICLQKIMMRSLNK